MPRRTLAKTFSAALCVLVAGCSNSKQESPSQLAARVNKSEISVHQVNFALSRQPAAAQGQPEAATRQVLEALIDQETAVQQALDRKLDREPGVMQALAAARREVLARAFAESVAATAAKPAAAEVKTYFDSKPALFAQRRVYSLQEVSVQASADQLEPLRERVRTAKAMQEVSDYLKTKKLPVRATRTTAAPESLPAPLVDVLAKAREGQALFLPSPGGARILIVAGVQDAPLTFEQSSAAIEQLLLQQRRRQVVDAEVKTLRKNSRVEYLGRFAQAAASAPQGATSSSTLATQSPTDPNTASADTSSADAALVRRGLGASIK
jgi:EpsD family peptidyl-prolyl cis-trans isomerase